MGASEAGATAREVYAFVAWTCISVCFALFLLWAWAPAEALHTVGVTWYPSRWWALALPAWVCVAVVYAYTVYESLNLLLTAAPESISSVADASTKLLAWEDGMPHTQAGKGGRPEGAVRRAPGAMGDLRLGDVCDMLYGAPAAAPT